MTDKTMTFKLGDDHEDYMRDTLTQVFDALKEKGYNPINQIVGYILSEDPPQPVDGRGLVPAARCLR